jgi:hypothetical protein
MTELHPSECLIRLCRFCKHPMLQRKYEADTVYRWYMFYCDPCNIHTVIGESLEPEATCTLCDGFPDSNHEPLHSKEECSHEDYKYI